MKSKIYILGCFLLIVGLLFNSCNDSSITNQKMNEKTESETMGLITMPAPSGKLSKDLLGVWILQSREDYTEEGQKRIDLTLGERPLGILAYGNAHFTAQFMKLDRNEDTNDVSYSGANNTIAIGGYDAYFGVYEVNEKTGQVQHTLKGSINNDNIGISVWRDLRVSDGKLIIQLETTTIEGEPIIRTLIWKRDDIN